MENQQALQFGQQKMDLQQLIREAADIQNLG
jgi:hypothetical protein